MQRTMQHIHAFWLALLCASTAIAGAAAEEPVAPSGDITLADAIAAEAR